MQENKIIYGGAFNPPTIAHYEIIKYITKKFPKKQLIILPTNDFYNKQSLVSFDHRYQMLSLICRDFSNVEISEYEKNYREFLGTYYILQHFNNPYFVIGADALLKIDEWIKYPEIVLENHFIVLPRDNIDINMILNNNQILKQCQNHFIICDDFSKINISSTNFRSSKDFTLLNEKIKQYILKNKLYQEEL